MMSIYTRRLAMAASIFFGYQAASPGAYLYFLYEPPQNSSIDVNNGIICNGKLFNTSSQIVEGETITVKVFDGINEAPMSTVAAVTRENSNWGDGNTVLLPPSGGWPCGTFYVEVWHLGSHQTITIDTSTTESSREIEGVSSGCQ